MILSVIYKLKSGEIFTAGCGENPMTFKIFGDLEEEHKAFLGIEYFEVEDAGIIPTLIDNYMINLETKALVQKYIIESIKPIGGGEGGNIN